MPKRSVRRTQRRKNTLRRKNTIHRKTLERKTRGGINLMRGGARPAPAASRQQLRCQDGSLNIMINLVKQEKRVYLVEK